MFVMHKADPASLAQQAQPQQVPASIPLPCHTITHQNSQVLPSCQVLSKLSPDLSKLSMHQNRAPGD